MSVREPWRIRKAVLAGVVALALTGTGVAIGWSATDSPAPTPSKSAPAKPDKSQRPQHLHSESVVKKRDGTFETVLNQHGTVDTVSDTSVTVRSEDGFTQSYAVNAGTRIVKFPAPAADGSPAKGDDGKRLKPSEVTLAEIATGESVRISGVKKDGTVTAEKIVAGGHGPGLGQGHGKGLWKGQGGGPDKGKGHGADKHNEDSQKD